MKSPCVTLQYGKNAWQSQEKKGKSKYKTTGLTLESSLGLLKQQDFSGWPCTESHCRPHSHSWPPVWECQLRRQGLCRDNEDLLLNYSSLITAQWCTQKRYQAGFCTASAYIRPVNKVSLVFKSYQSVIPIPAFKLSNYCRSSLMKTVEVSQAGLCCHPAQPCHWCVPPAFTHFTIFWVLSSNRSGIHLSTEILRKFSFKNNITVIYHPL